MDPEGRVPENVRDERESQLDEGEDEVEVVKMASDPDRPTCPRCGWHNTRLSHTKTIVDSVLRAFSLRAYRCRSCGNRFRAVRRVAKA